MLFKFKLGSIFFKKIFKTRAVKFQWVLMCQYLLKVIEFSKIILFLFSRKFKMKENKIQFSH